MRVAWWIGSIATEDSGKAERVLATSFKLKRVLPADDAEESELPPTWCLSPRVGGRTLWAAALQCAAPPVPRRTGHRSGRDHRRDDSSLLTLEVFRPRIRP